MAYRRELQSESEIHSCLTRCDPMGYSPWNSPGQNTGVHRLSLLQGIIPTQGSNPGLLQFRWILYQLSHKGSPNYIFLTDGRLTVTLELAFPFPTSITFPHCLHWVFRSLIPPASGYLITIPDSSRPPWSFEKTDANRGESCRATKSLRGLHIVSDIYSNVIWCQKCFWASPFQRSSLLPFQEGLGTFPSQVWPQQTASPIWESQSFLSSSI